MINKREKFPPLRILIMSDDNELEFVKTETSKAKKVEILFVYKYVKSELKQGTLIAFTETELKKQLEIFFKPIS